ncbi:translation initiation factor IF-2-like [Rousettus aegyptiacus]|uniref:translation initiation factor IF-2-like n=1 Tax=Rousettus aegyptiacus TaxID=9407 RepID=UPI00168CFADA|nr:translation initiation factor IF-2-like [Rousettus aegyptiacus]
MVIRHICYRLPPEGAKDRVVSDLCPAPHAVSQRPPEATRGLHHLSYWFSAATRGHHPPRWFSGGHQRPPEATTRPAALLRPPEAATRPAGSPRPPEATTTRPAALPRPPEATRGRHPPRWFPAATRGRHHPHAAARAQHGHSLARQIGARSLTPPPTLDPSLKLIQCHKAAVTTEEEIWKGPSAGRSGEAEPRPPPPRPARSARVPSARPRARLPARDRFPRAAGSPGRASLLGSPGRAPRRGPAVAQARPSHRLAARAPCEDAGPAWGTSGDGRQCGRGSDKRCAADVSRKSDMAHSASLTQPYEVRNKNEQRLHQLLPSCGRPPREQALRNALPLAFRLAA